MFPWLMKRLPGPHQKIFSLTRKIIDFVKIKINEHKGNFDPSAPEDYIDSFLIEMEKVSVGCVVFSLYHVFKVTDLKNKKNVVIMFHMFLVESRQRFWI